MRTKVSDYATFPADATSPGAETPLARESESESRLESFWQAAMLRRQLEIAALDFPEFNGYAWAFNCLYMEIISLWGFLIGAFGLVVHRLLLPQSLLVRLPALDCLQLFIMLTAASFFVVARTEARMPKARFQTVAIAFVATVFLDYYIIGKVGGLSEPWPYTMLFNSMFSIPAIMGLYQRIALNTLWGVSAILGFVLARPEELLNPFLPLMTGLVACGAFFSTAMGAWMSERIREHHESTWQLHRVQLQLEKEKERALHLAESKAHEATAALLRLENVRNEERHHISRELHDELGHLIVTHNLSIQKFREAHQAEPLLIEYSDRLLQELDAIESGARRVIAQLRSHASPRLLVQEVLGDLVQQFSASCGIPCELVVEPEDLHLQDELLAVTFRIVQEALNNIRKHSEASKVEVSINLSKSVVHLYIRDNGRGLTSEDEGFGLPGIRERIRLVDGEFQLTSEASNGVELSISFPVKPPGDWKGQAQ